MKLDIYYVSHIYAKKEYERLALGIWDFDCLNMINTYIDKHITFDFIGYLSHRLSPSVRV